jgi:uncharacterized membrane-anchored protein
MLIALFFAIINLGDKMNRYTKKVEDKFIVEESSYNAAINKLGLFEDMVDKILNEQEKISKELASLRSNNQTKSFRFRQLLGHKLTNSALISILESNNLI